MAHVYRTQLAALKTEEPDSTRCFADNERRFHCLGIVDARCRYFSFCHWISRAWPQGTSAAKLLKNNIEIHEMRISKIDSQFTIFDAEQYPVVDSRHMYTLFENYYNPSAYNYIVNGRLYNKEGQTEFSEQSPT